MANSCSGFWPLPDPPSSLGIARLKSNEPELTLPLRPAPEAIASAVYYATSSESSISHEYSAYLGTLQSHDRARRSPQGTSERWLLLANGLGGNTRKHDGGKEQDANVDQDSGPPVP